MKKRYQDWSEEELERALEMRKNEATYKLIGEALKRPYGQVRGALASIERMERAKAAGWTPLDYKLATELSVIGTKLEQLKSPFGKTCLEAASYIGELHREIRKEDERRRKMVLKIQDEKWYGGGASDEQ